MKYYEVIQALVLRMTELSQQDDLAEIDVDTRIVVAAAREIIQDWAREIDAPVFDLDSVIDKALLLKAVASINPEIELADEEKEVIAEVRNLKRKNLNNIDN